MEGQMSTTFKVLALLAALIATGCATAPTEVSTKTEVPPPKPGEVAVFGGMRLVEEIGVYLPNQDQDGYIYLTSDADGKSYKISCFDSGEFGVYLPAGSYKVDKAKLDGYTFTPHIQLNVPGGYKAVYTGIIELDGTPTGVDQATDKTVFIYSILDESTEFAEALRRKAPGAELNVYKSLFIPDGSTATGKYPTKVFRAADVQNDLQARSDAVEEVVKGGVITLFYCISPVWLLTVR
jgi:hypothetical protein